MVSLSIHSLISPMSTYRRCMRDNWPRAVDYIVGLVRGFGIWPRVVLISCALRRSNRQFVAAFRGVELLGFVFGGPGAFLMSHTIGVSVYGGGLRGLVLPFVRRSDSIFCYL